MDVVLLEASLNRSMNAVIASSRVYSQLEISLGKPGFQCSTKISANTSHPRWNHFCDGDNLAVYMVNSAKIELKVQDAAHYPEDSKTLTEIGSALLKVTDLLASKSFGKEIAVPLIATTGEQKVGSLKVWLTWTPAF